MKVLIIGNGGREHALAWKINQSPYVTKIFCSPGNGGTCEIAENVSISPGNIEELISFAKKENIGLTVVGPELPLTLGITDEFIKHGLKIFGVSKRAAKLEGSKAYAKKFLKKYNIPTAEYEVFDNPDLAIEYIKSKKENLVIKADGLAAGKGVYICKTLEEAIEAVSSIMGEKKFGAAGDRIVIEEFLIGKEASFLALSDGNNIIPLATSQDHKTIYDGDKGPNTGGMGAYSPTHIINDELHKEIMDTIIKPTIEGMRKEDRLYKGILYAGIMICKNVPKVLEFNVRFGDPETQPILFRMETDIVPVFNSVINSTLDKEKIVWKEKIATTVVMTSKGYPGTYGKGKEIKGLNNLKKDNSLMVFHAGTKLVDGKVVTDGGRVLGVTALGSDMKESIEKAYMGVSKISFDGAYYRKDIGKREN